MLVEPDTTPASQHGRTSLSCQFQTRSLQSAVAAMVLQRLTKLTLTGGASVLESRVSVLVTILIFIFTIELTATMVVLHR